MLSAISLNLPSFSWKPIQKPSPNPVLLFPSSFLDIFILFPLSLMSFSTSPPNSFRTFVLISPDGGKAKKAENPTPRIFLRSHRKEAAAIHMLMYLFVALIKNHKMLIKNRKYKNCKMLIKN